MRAIRDILTEMSTCTAQKRPQSRYTAHRNPQIRVERLETTSQSSTLTKTKGVWKLRRIMWWIYWTEQNRTEQNFIYEPILRPLTGGVREYNTSKQTINKGTGNVIIIRHKINCQSACWGLFHIHFEIHILPATLALFLKTLREK